MNREIKFRFWKTETKEWVNFPSRAVNSFEPLIHEDYTDSDYFIIQQYTGFKDKNGKEIYEGDWCLADGKRVIIIFQDGMFGYDTCLGMHCILIPELMEVIGNKFEQEELIKIYETKEFYQCKKN